MEALKEIFTFLGGLNSMPGYGLAFLACIAVGFMLKTLKEFPNEAIPTVVILFGAVVNILLADPMAPPMTIRLWVTKNLVIGIIIGFSAWMTHNLILIRLIKKFRPKNGDSLDTETIVKPTDKTT